MKVEARLQRIGQIITEIRLSMNKPGCRTLNSLEMEQRADRLRNYATGAKLAGRKVNKDYE